MRDYHGVYHGKEGWAGRSASYVNDLAALDGMKTLALKKNYVDDEGKQKEKMVFYSLEFLKCGNRVVYNG